MATVTNASDGVRIHYDDEGRGPAIVFHTGAGGDSRIWQAAGYTTGLQGFRHILIDQRGRGRSDRPTTVESHQMECFVSDVRVVLDDAAVESCAFWGYSSGILTGIAFGTAYPDRLRGLVGTGALPFCNLAELPPLDPEAWIREDVAQGGVGHEVDSLMISEHDRFPEAIDRNVREGDPVMHALDRLGRRRWRGPLDLYRRFRPPVLILTGEKEDQEEETKRSAALLPNVKLVRLAGVGHLGAFYRSDLTLPHALPFLEERLR